MTSIELASVGAVLQGIGSIAGALAIIGAAWFASNTFDSWRRQKLSERRIEQAERILTATYKARRALRYVRSPMLWAHELDAAEKELTERDDWPMADAALRRRMVSAQTYFDRLNRTLEERKSIDECLPMARALFGEEVENALDELNRQFHLVSIAAEASVDAGNDRDFQRSLRADLSSAGGSKEPNKMNETIEAQVAAIEAVCLPVLRLEGTLKG
ncbi:MAG: hypothetical protein ABL308_09430 [Oceanicaulis sp.]